MNNNYNDQNYNNYNQNPYGQPNPYGQQNPYGQPNYGYNQYGESNGMYYNPQTGLYEKRTNQLAVVGFILSFFFNIVGAILCMVALSQIKKSGEGGKGLAIAGIIIGIVPFLLFIAFFALIFIIAYEANYEDGEYYDEYYDEYYKGVESIPYDAINTGRGLVSNYSIDFEENVIEILK